MKEADIVLAPLTQSDGKVKNRPVLLLRELPPFGDFLVCGISTQIRQAVPGFDEVFTREDAGFAESGLVTDSVIRLGFLAVWPRKKMLGSIGTIGGKRHRRLLRNLCRHLSAAV